MRQEQGLEELVPSLTENVPGWQCRLAHGVVTLASRVPAMLGTSASVERPVRDAIPLRCLESARVGSQGQHPFQPRARGFEYHSLHMMLAEEFCG